MSVRTVLPEDIEKHLVAEYGLPKENVKMMLDASKQSLTENIALAVESVANGDSKTLLRAAHSMKGALLNLGQKEVADVAGALEKIAESPDSQDQFLEYIADLKDGLKLLM